MNILVIGATGTIGKAVLSALSPNHHVISAGFNSGDVTVDLSSKASIKDMYKTVGRVGAVVSTAGLGNFGSFSELDDAAYDLALKNKLMGQINLVRLGRDHVENGGSFTLTAGTLSRQPMPGSVVLSMANGALESFARSAALELDQGHRLNTVSPSFVKETMEVLGMDPTPGLSAADTAKAYVAAVEGDMTGKTLDAQDYAGGTNSRV
ncbi:MAG: short chain dehydrogenase [Roseibium sp.]|uniref:short chain dehydrogenase n=1 Tax=Roseibium sp. TaxID=1936156 RepID=UPI002632EC4A|nr:short chain dehydrogenase [Roseibium sp.]MCV0426920.1 short chain dehydrogenase [Roseibium sp.]